MSGPEQLADLTTEAVNPASAAIDAMDESQIAALMNAEDARVVEAVQAALPSIARAIAAATASLAAGARIIYVGAGTSGRLGVLDASECPPTFNSPRGQVVGLIAGGPEALTNAVEGAEDDPERGATDIASLGVNPADCVVGIATSGRTPYVLGAIERAGALGATTVGLACNLESELAGRVAIMIEVVVGPEVIAGSTRLKAGTATKMVLNMISTGAMVRIGKTYGNRMVDLRPSNRKLRERTIRLLVDLGGVDRAEAVSLLDRADGELKPAIVAARTSVDFATARDLLARHGGQVRRAIAAAGGTPP